MMNFLFYIFYYSIFFLKFEDEFKRLQAFANQNLLVSRHKKNLTHPVNSVNSQASVLVGARTMSYMQSVQEEDTAI